MKEAILYRKLRNKVVECQACNHKCQIDNGHYGICQVRENSNGVLYSRNYGQIIAEHVDPIEKKPLYHFLPGSQAYSIAAAGCNFKCQHCQNAEISQASPLEDLAGAKTEPNEIINAAIKDKCQSIAYTYTEPTIFIEFALETMKLAKQQGLKNVWVSNGYFSDKALKIISPFLDAINVDLKFFSKDSYLKICGAKLDPILDNLIAIKKKKIHLEVTTLIITGINDSPIEIKQIADFIADKLGVETPWHVSAFYPAFKMSDIPPTATADIVLAHKLGQKAGLQYVYPGNIPVESLDNTYCPYCNNLLIDRHGYITDVLIKKNRCPKCKNKVNIVF